MSETQTGVKPADEFVAMAREFSLKVDVEVQQHPNETAPQLGYTLVSVTVTIPIPEGLTGDLTGIFERAERLHVIWTKFHKQSSRGRFISASHYTIGGHEDLHVLRRATRKVELMHVSAQRLQRYARR